MLDNAKSKTHKSYSGIFYRQPLPYKVTVCDPDVPDCKGNATTRNFIAFSPSEAPVEFLPIKRSLFANNEAKLKFNSEGVPTGYTQSVDGELVGLAKLPATFITSYFEAIGNMFHAKSSNLANEKAYLDALNQLAIQKLKNQACQNALNAIPRKTDAEIQAACTGG